MSFKHRAQEKIKRQKNGGNIFLFPPFFVHGVLSVRLARDVGKFAGATRKIPRGYWSFFTLPSRLITVERNIVSMPAIA